MLNDVNYQRDNVKKWFYTKKQLAVIEKIKNCQLLTACCQLFT